MEKLRAIFESLGCREVETLIQSGNVIFDAPRSTAASLSAKVRAAIRAECAIDVPIVISEAKDFAALAEAHPFEADARDPKELHIAFLEQAPAAGARAKLDPDRSPPDRFRVQGAAIYMHCPNGVAKTRLTCDYFDRTLGELSTMRNWNTVRKIAARLSARTMSITLAGRGWARVALAQRGSR